MIKMAAGMRFRVALDAKTARRLDTPSEFTARNVAIDGGTLIFFDASGGEPVAAYGPGAWLWIGDEGDG